MLTFREELELYRLRQAHLACMVGWLINLVAVVAWLAIAYLEWSRLAPHFIAVHVTLGGLFFAVAQRPLRRIHQLEQFA